MKTRFQFVTERDGPEEAEVYRKRMVQAYRGTCLGNKRKQGKRYAYRREHIEGYLEFKNAK